MCLLPIKQNHTLGFKRNLQLEYFCKFTMLSFIKNFIHSNIGVILNIIKISTAKDQQIFMNRENKS